MRPEELSPQLKGAKTRLLKLLEKRLKIAALNMEGRSKEPTFSRFNNQTGRLRQSIAGRYDFVDGKPTAILSAGGAFGGKELKYAGAIEFGTSTAGRGRNVVIRPRFFLKRSVEEEQKDLKPKLQALLKAAVAGRSDG
jgi:phage gpG-like protein